MDHYSQISQMSDSQLKQTISRLQSSAGATPRFPTWQNQATPQAGTCFIKPSLYFSVNKTRNPLFFLLQEHHGKIRTRGLAVVRIGLELLRLLQ